MRVALARSCESYRHPGPSPDPSLQFGTQYLRPRQKVGNVSVGENHEATRPLAVMTRSPLRESVGVIEALARCRQDARNLARMGHGVLDILPLDSKLASSHEDPSERGAYERTVRENERYWHPIEDRISKATLLMARVSQQRLHDRSIEEVLQDPRWSAVIEDLKRIDLRDLRTAEPRDVPVLRAARTLRVLVACQSAVSSSAAFACLRRLFEELYSSANRDYCVGGAAAGRGGRPTAFITSECVRAIFSFARLLARTGDLLESLSAILGDAQVRAARARVGLAPAWTECDLAAVILNAQCALQERLHNTLVVITSHQVRKLAECKSVESVADHLRNTIVSKLRACIQASVVACQENSDSVPQPSPHGEEYPFRSFAGWLGTEYARIVLSRIGAKAQELNDKLAGVDQGGSRASSHEAILRDVASDFHKSAEEIRMLTKPARRFFSRVLDREIARAATTTDASTDLPELVFAAAGFGVTSGAWKDRRILHALQFALSRMEHGTPWLPGRPFATDPGGFALHAIAPQVSTAVLRIAHESGYLLSEAEARAVLHPLESTLEEIPGAGPGWRHEHEAGSKRSQWVTAIIVSSLHKYIQTLDRQINTRILKSFTHRLPDSIGVHLHLGRICYADYGIASLEMPSPAVDRAGARRSSAIVLAQLRGHLLARADGKAVSFLGTVDEQREHSVIIHGPPGTGKTSLIEALAATTGRPVVQVTPSDIVVGGQEMAEQQMDLVFRALLQLTRAVVVFDEFDQLLTERTGEPKAPTGVFELITPSALTKLRDLNDKAIENRLAYGLATNFLSVLDPAIKREGRFGRRIGLYCPDVLSRATRIFGVASRACFLLDGNSQRGSSEQVWMSVLARHDTLERMARAIRLTGGLSVKELEQLLAGRVFGEPRDQVAPVFESVALRYIMAGDCDALESLVALYKKAIRRRARPRNRSRLDPQEVADLDLLRSEEKALRRALRPSTTRGWEALGNIMGIIAALSVNEGSVSGRRSTRSLRVQLDEGGDFLPPATVI